MGEGIIEQLPKVVKEGKKVFNRILDRINKGGGISFQVNEYVIASPDVMSEDFFKNITNDDGEFVNKLIYGDNILSLAGLLSLKNQGKLGGGCRFSLY
jgi:site-specific DNA-methyltransferase (adenine-specific)/adenine-specific DNA-methyltransferase